MSVIKDHDQADNLTDADIVETAANVTFSSFDAQDEGYQQIISYISQKIMSSRTLIMNHVSKSFGVHTRSELGSDYPVVHVSLSALNSP